MKVNIYVEIDISEKNESSDSIIDTGSSSEGNEYLGFDEFCSLYQKIHENSQNPKQVFQEGFSFLDVNK